MKKLFCFILIIFVVGACGESTMSPVDEITYVKYFAEKKLFSFEKPKYWIDKTSGYNVQFDGPTKNGVHFTIITRVKASKSVGGTFKSNNEYLAALEKQWRTAKEYKKHGKGNITISGYRALDLTVSYIYGGNSFKTRQVIFKTKKGYFIRLAYTGPVDGFMDYMPVMDRMILSFKIESSEI